MSAGYSIETPLALIGPAHFLISVSTNLCRYSGELRSRATRSAPISCMRVFTAGAGGVDGRERGGMKLVDNRRGCSLGQEGGKPVRCVEIGQPLLMRGRLRRQARRAIAREDRDRLDHLALNLGYRDRRIGALVVDPA